ncbi:hypothetical protein OGAPHI_005279 [Ogataea philodendri]|uniref:W2 domain-containing protein n=1 Tax=Ogataea philodendri TaxID=1378263 RepID=A0A9P8T3J5_9ASCO|nr:uncharacterized protein OGAPHI_005279 [Ogataea philodendri]KAH3663876.1 hypothetical protein OGAPHI_005279 [Ogataea philodendri]
MSLINICRENNDPFYRYKMPAIQAKTEGRGNGIKTNVLNAADVAKALARPTAYVIKYFGFELGALTNIDDEKEKFVVNGQHDAGKLQDVLDNFINKFVLCPSCKNPETELTITKDDNVMRDCKACGKITSCDPRQKLVTYILKNPPPKKSKKSGTASANVGGGGTKIAEIAEKQQDNESGAGDFAGEAPPSRKVVVKDEDWAVDMSEEAVKARARELEGLTLSSSANDKFEEFGEWLLQGDLPDDVEIFRKASETGIIGEPKTIEVLAQVLFTEDIVDQIEEHKGLLGKLVTSEKHEMSLLGGIERLIGLQHPDLIKSVPKVLMSLYDNDLVSEDVARDWGTHVSKKFVPKETSKKVRKAAKPFIKWLDEAEEESDDE